MSKWRETQKWVAVGYKVSEMCVRKNFGAGPPYLGSVKKGGSATLVSTAIPSVLTSCICSTYTAPLIIRTKIG